MNTISLKKQLNNITAIDLGVSTPRLSGFIETNSMPNLVSLSASSNDIEDFIFSLQNDNILQEIGLSDNKLKGTANKYMPKNIVKISLDDNLLTDIGNLDKHVNLEDFRCSRNSITSNIPSIIYNTNLVIFKMFKNSMTGNIPDLSNNTALEDYQVNGNNLTGILPSGVISSNVRLKVFKIGGNAGLTGSVPDLSNNADLTIYEAYFTQVGGSIPNLDNNTKLISFNSSNSGITGSIPSLAALPALKNLVIGENNLAGSIPNLDNNTNLVKLEVKNNNLTGSIPNLDNNTKLAQVLVSWNTLTGSLPSLAALPVIEQFVASNNQLTGSIPAFGSNANLKLFNIGSNTGMNGSIPSLDTLTKLEDFIANRCNLSGDIPSLTNNTELKSLNIENNNMTGFTDSAITSKLVDIKAKNNAFTFTAVNNILARLVEAGASNGTLEIDGTGNAGPTGQGIIDKATLISNGWTVSTNSSLYNMTPVAYNINEGTALTVDILAPSINLGSVYWTVTTPGEFTPSSGTATIISGVGSFTVTPTADETTEPNPETFQIELRTGSTSGPVIATTADITINDTSKTPAYTVPNIYPILSNVNEGSSFTIDVVTTNVADGTILYYTIGDNAGDFSTTNGTITINSNTGSFAVTPTADATSEGTETFTVQIRTGSISGPVVLTTPDITINDTSVPFVGYTGLQAFDNGDDSVDEGGLLIYGLDAENIVDNTTVPYTITGDVNSADINGAAMTGNFTIVNNYGGIAFGIAVDQLTEGTETIVVTLGATDSAGNPTGSLSKSININDLSLSPGAYNITSVADNVDEGSSLQIDVSTTDVPDGTNLYWTVAQAREANGTVIFPTIDVNDFSESSGQISISNNTASFNISPVTDSNTEGDEFFRAQLHTGSIAGPVVATTGTLTINDTTMPPATYAVSTTQTSVDEGGTVTWDVVTTNVPDGTTLYYMTEGTGAGDVTPADTTGSFIITNNAGSFTQTLIEDGTTDGTVTFRVKIRTGLRGGRNLAFSQTIPVNDTSQPPTYQTLVSNVDTVDEGGNFTITLTTVQIADNTTVPYTISGVDSADINGAPLTGNFTVNNNTASANFTVSLDSAVEGMETFTLAISDAIGTISVNVAINDGPTIRTVTVASGTNIYGTGNKYYFAELGASAGQIISLNEEVTYRFDQSDSSNSNHQLLFSTTANGTHGGGVEYTAGVTKVGTAGTAGAYTQITVPAGAPTLHYYCINHANMGNVANTPVSNYQYINSSFETMFN